MGPFWKSRTTSRRPSKKCNINRTKMSMSPEGEWTKTQCSVSKFACLTRAANFASASSWSEANYVNTSALETQIRLFFFIDFFLENNTPLARNPQIRLQWSLFEKNIILVPSFILSSMVACSIIFIIVLLSPFLRKLQKSEETFISGLLSIYFFLVPLAPLSPSFILPSLLYVSQTL